VSDLDLINNSSRVIIKSNDLNSNERLIKIPSIERLTVREKVLAGEVIQGPKGDPGPPGGFETVAITISEVGEWHNVPLQIIKGVVDVIVYDQRNREKVEIDTRINIDNTVDVKSSILKTYNVHVLGY